jgi:hypothetical protein
MGKAAPGGGNRTQSLELMAERVGFESTTCMEAKEFCGAAWPSEVLKGKGGNS